MLRASQAGRLLHLYRLGIAGILRNLEITGILRNLMITGILRNLKIAVPGSVRPS